MQAPPYPVAHGRPKNFRPEINALRAVAVIGVVIYHLFPQTLPGGFVGVDVFFVVSGYLITGIILSRMERGTFSVLDFYARRARRIFPALALTVGLTLVVATLCYPSSLFRLTGETAFYAALQISNFLFAGKTGYFELDPAQAANPLLHTWSLGVEEQFYLVWPALLLLATRLGSRAAVAWILVAICALSLALAEYWLAYDDGRRAFFWPLSRAWEFGIGGLAYVFAANRERNTASGRPLLTLAGLVAGLAMIGYAMFHTPQHPFPGVAAILPCAGALLVILLGPEALSAPSGARKVLESSPVTLIGLTSYSIYLLHYPLSVFLDYLAGGSAPSTLAYGATIGALLGLSYASWRFVENPFRTPGRLPAPVSHPATLGVAMTVIALAGWSTAHDRIWGWRLSSGAIATAGQPGNRHVTMLVRAKCTLNDERRRKLEPSFFTESAQCFFGGAENPEVVLIGNSHLYHAFEIAPSLGADSRAGFAAIETWELLHDRDDPEHQMITEGIRRFISRLDPEWVIIAHRHVPHEQPLFTRKTAALVDFALSEGSRVLLLGQVPHFPFNIHNCIEARSTMVRPRNTPPDCTRVSRDQVLAEVALGNRILEDIAASRPGAFFYDPTTHFCDETDCHAVVDGVLQYRREPDTSNHLNEAGIDRLGRMFARDLRLGRFPTTDQPTGGRNR